MNKTILFFLALVLAATTACGRGSSNNNPVKEETMATEGNGKVIHLTKAEFLAKVYNFEKNPEEWKYEGDKPAIVDFYADWCGPCKMLGSVLETISDIEIIKVNVDEYPVLASRFKIMSIPHLKFFNDGKEIDHIVGFVDKETIEEKVMELNNL